MTQRVEENILMRALTERQARNVAAMLKRRGYTQAIIEDCRRRSPVEIAAFFEPYDSDLQKQLADDIATSAGYKPKQEKKGKKTS